MPQKIVFTALLAFASFVVLQMGYSAPVSADSMMGDGSMGDGMMRRTPGNGEKQPLQDKNSKERKVYGKYCGQCHASPSPRVHTAEDWPSVIDRMMQRIAQQGKARPDSEQLKMILGYVKHYAK